MSRHTESRLRNGTCVLDKLMNGALAFLNAGYPGTEGMTIKEPSLTITRPTFDDTGEYFCNAKDSLSTQTGPAIQLNVIGGIPKVEITSVTQIVEYGQPFTLDCNITSFSNYTSVYWQQLYNGTTSNITSDYPGLTNISTMFPSMTIMKAVSSNSGLYTCYAENIVGTGSSDAVNVTVIGEYLGLSGNKTMYPSMTILKAVSADTGLYTCYAVNIVGTGYSEAVNVTIIGGTPKIEITPVTQIVEYGQPFTLDCNITSYPNHTSVYWQRMSNGTTSTITLDYPGLTGITTMFPSMTILKAVSTDSGLYTCVAVNRVGTGYSEAVNVIVVGDIPKVEITSVTQIVEYGQPLTLDCNITSFPNYTSVYWQQLYNGTLLNITSDYLGLSDNTTMYPSKTILKAVTADSGLYTCYAVNIVGTGYSDALNVTVIGGIPKVEITSVTQIVDYGQPFTLDCNITSFPNHTSVYWQRMSNGTTSNITSDYPELNCNTTMFPTMSILKAVSSDSGLYTCYAVNIVGTGYSDVVNVSVIGGIPKVEITSVTQIVEYGQPFTLDCNITSFPNHTSVYWQRMSNGTTSNITSDYPELNGNTTMFPSMSILKAVSADSGLYTCYAVNIVGTGYSDVVNVTVVGGIPKVEITSVTQIVEYGQPFTLDCNITSFPNHTSVYWQRMSYDTISYITSEYRGLTGIAAMFPSMTILKAVSSDSGLYTCYAVNIVGTGYSDAVNVTVIGGIPKVEMSSVTQIVEYGQPCTLYCNITSFPNHNFVYWQRISNGTISYITSEYCRITGITTMFPSMTILKAVSADSGLYTCNAVNIVGTGYSDTVNVTVIGGIPKVEITSVTQIVVYGQPFTLDCNITSFPNHTSVYWQRMSNGTTSNITSDYPELNGNTTMFPSISILKAVSSDSGLYTCYAVNIVGTGYSDVVNVTVIGGIPKVEITSVTQIVEYGQPFTLDCNITSFPNYTSVYWQQLSNGTTSNITSDYPGLSDITTMFPSMTIMKAVSTESGLYTCYAVNIVGIGYSDAVNVTVIGGIPKVEITSVTQIVEYGEPFSLDCNITSFPNHTSVYWQRMSNGTTLNITSDYPGLTGNTTLFPSMTILKVVSADSGLYKCYAENIVGTGSSDAVNVTVIGGKHTFFELLKEFAYQMHYFFGVLI
ncbi:HMCN [Mytilus coruscus]|uniref:HMCN n=1 Tax=Mytilus coruscus TaxID=42192 RepID=A0A6J8EXJ7_MYTCO|nr:HMCN [Mytilus coruscus]